LRELKRISRSGRRRRAAGSRASAIRNGGARARRRRPCLMRCHWPGPPPPPREAEHTSISRNSPSPRRRTPIPTTPATHHPTYAHDLRAGGARGVWPTRRRSLDCTRTGELRAPTSRTLRRRGDGGESARALAADAPRPLSTSNRPRQRRKHDSGAIHHYMRIIHATKKYLFPFTPFSWTLSLTTFVQTTPCSRETRPTRNQHYTYIPSTSLRATALPTTFVRSNRILRERTARHHFVLVVTSRSTELIPCAPHLWTPTHT